MKKFLYKVYDKDDNYITTWNDVESTPSFYGEINGGISDTTISLARSIWNYGENKDVKLGNQVNIHAYDSDTGSTGRIIYKGYIGYYEPMIDGAKETVRVVLYNWWSQTANFILSDSGATTVTYIDQDPSDILKDILDKFQSVGGKLTYTGTSIQQTGTTVSYTFNTNTIQEAILKIPELCPVDWTFNIDPLLVCYLSEKPETEKHMFHVGQDITYYRQEKRTENIVNCIYFRGAGSLYKKYTNPSSISQYGTYSKKIIEERVTSTDTADIMANNILARFSAPEVRVSIRVGDNNDASTESTGGKHPSGEFFGNSFVQYYGYDIEKISVGETCKIFNLTSKSNTQWDEAIYDVDVWDYDITNSASIVLQIQKVTYYADYVELEISNTQPNVSRRIEDINRNLIEAQTADNPVTPS